MVLSLSPFHLQVQRVEQVCLFQLSWGRGQQLATRLPYWEILTTLEGEWRRIYINFYKTGLRGRVTAAGSLPPPSIDWHAKLVQAEAQLLNEFHHWLRQSELYEIRAAIASLERETGGKLSNREIFLTCDPVDLARLPWETWDIGTEFGAKSQIRIVRTPVNIRKTTTKNPLQRRSKARILAILGDDTGLNFQADKEAVKSLDSLAEIEFIGWQLGQDTEELKTQIANKIACETGWDILFFAGHSNETILTGGEIAIAPDVVLSLKEIEKPLAIAKEHGLQFAIFNSCNGLSIANALIDLGLSQVAVMREPIHNQVAQIFLWQFVRHLADYKNVGEAVAETSRYLKQELYLKYPSAYLIPSLFRHPDAPLFRIEPNRKKQWLKHWIPNRKEAISLAVLVLFSWQLSVQNFLLERRVLTQAFYRQITNQIPNSTSPEILLVQIDDKSIVKAKIKDPTPMDRAYLAKLIERASALNAKVIGIDYLLDRPHGKSDFILSQSLRKAVQKQPTWFVFAADRDDMENWVSVLPEIASLNWTLQGDMNLFYGYNKLMYAKLVPRKDASSRNLPFAYLLALSYRLISCDEKPNPPTPFPAREGGVRKITPLSLQERTEAIPTIENLQTEKGVIFTPLSLQERGRGRGQNFCDRVPQPKITSSIDFLSQLEANLTARGKDYNTLFSDRTKRNLITNFSYQIGNTWLHPIIDFSIPPNQVYQRISAWQFLEIPANQASELSQKVVAIAPGGYGDDPGVSVGNQDVFPLPLAVSYWRDRQNMLVSRRFLTGGEVHAYMFHNFLHQRLVIPIPDLWLIVVAVLLGKGIAIALVQNRSLQNKKWILLLVIFTIIYALFSWQIYISKALLLPLILPIGTFWTYILYQIRLELSPYSKYKI